MSDTRSTPRLLVRGKDGTCEEHGLTEDGLTIGRKSDNDLVLDDPTVSGHHARIARIQAAYFIEDCKSTNGTHVNGQRTDRRQLQDADVIAIGPFRLVYRGEVATEASRTTAATDLDQTIAFTGQGGQAAPKKPIPYATVHVLSGGTAQDRYELTEQVTVIGSKEDAAIRLTGWFTPKVAALIARRGTGYVFTPAGSGRKIKINDQPVKEPLQLEEGDRIEVAGIIFRVSFKTEKKAA
ncbi:hypothetical protein YTPLAS18_14050 [Nitrospira sp.]|nr:hypothetical protein YTPLAS18_14050 [Nitrospira sp.]